MSQYFIKEIFNTLQGEGARAGARSVFVRFAGCNLWDGLPEHRARGKGACAQWCDTDFASGTGLPAHVILNQIEAVWPAPLPYPYRGNRWCVLTGGEPLLQVDEDLLLHLHQAGWLVAVETNGTIRSRCLSMIDWLTVSPKLPAHQSPIPEYPALKYAHEVKVVLPGAIGDGVLGWSDEELMTLDMASPPSAVLYVQPQDPIDPTRVNASLLHGNVGDGSLVYQQNLARCIKHCMSYPRWRVSMQTHKYMRLP